MTEAPDLAAFHRDGFLAVRRFATESQVAELRSNVERYVAEVVPGLPQREHVFYEDRARPETLKQLQQLGRHDAYFERLQVDGPFRRLAEVVLGGEVRAVNMQYFSKPPGDGLATPPHQDGHYFMLTPCEAVTMWLALDPVDERNGCVRYVRGSHQQPLRPHAATGVLGFSQGITDYGSVADRAAEVPMPAAPGDLLVHHAKTIHRADGNCSADRPRRALGWIYYAAHAIADEAAHAAYQLRLRDELSRAGRL